MITHGDNGTFWSVVQKGEKQAATDLGVSVNYQGSNNDDAQECQFISAAVTAKPDGLAVSPHSQTVLDCAKQAAAGGLPLILINNCGDTASGQSHIAYSGSITCAGQPESAAGQLLSEGSMIAFVRRAARWPYAVHLYPRRHVASVADLDEAERWDLARSLLSVAGTYDRHFGFSTPHVMAMHQAPTDGRARPEAHLHIEFYPPHRRGDRLKYLAGVELGAGTFVNDTHPEDTTSQLRSAVRTSTLKTGPVAQKT